MGWRASDGDTFYVDAGVGQSGDGTSWGTAFLTVREGVDGACEAGDGHTVVIADGDYEIDEDVWVLCPMRIQGDGPVQDFVGGRPAGVKDPASVATLRDSGDAVDSVFVVASSHVQIQWLVLEGDGAGTLLDVVGGPHGDGVGADPRCPAGPGISDVEIREVALGYSFYGLVASYANARFVHILSTDHFIGGALLAGYDARAALIDSTFTDNLAFGLGSAGSATPNGAKCPPRATDARPTSQTVDIVGNDFSHNGPAWGWGLRNMGHFIGGHPASARATLTANVEGNLLEGNTKFGTVVDYFGPGLAPAQYRGTFRDNVYAGNGWTDAHFGFTHGNLASVPELRDDPSLYSQDSLLVVSISPAIPFDYNNPAELLDADGEVVQLNNELVVNRDELVGRSLTEP